MLCCPMAAFSWVDEFFNASVIPMATLFGEPMKIPSYTHAIIWLSFNMVKWLNLLQILFLSLYILCVIHKESVFNFFISLLISSTTEIQWHLLNRSLSTLVVRIGITSQPRDGNLAASGNTDQRHGRRFIISRIFIPCRLSSNILHKAFTMNQHFTDGWYIPSTSVTV